MSRAWQGCEERAAANVTQTGDGSTSGRHSCLCSRLIHKVLVEAFSAEDEATQPQIPGQSLIWGMEGIGLG